MNTNKQKQIVITATTEAIDKLGIRDLVARSKCCQATLVTQSSDEGTGFYSCSSCHQPCDALSDVVSTPVQRVSQEKRSTGMTKNTKTGEDWEEEIKRIFAQTVDVEFPDYDMAQQELLNLFDSQLQKLKEGCKALPTHGSLPKGSLFKSAGLPLVSLGDILTLIQEVRRGNT